MHKLAADTNAPFFSPDEGANMLSRLAKRALRDVKKTMILLVFIRLGCQHTLVWNSGE